MNEPNNDIVTELVSMYLAEYLPDLISLLLFLIAAIFILKGTVNLFKNYKAPGINIMFYSAIGTLLSLIIYVAYSLIFNEEENQIFEQITSILFSVLFLLGAYGFLQLCKHLINEKKC